MLVYKNRCLVKTVFEIEVEKKVVKMCLVKNAFKIEVIK
jgi:hypothetical protein